MLTGLASGQEPRNQETQEMESSAPVGLQNVYLILLLVSGALNLLLLILYLVK